MKRRLLFLFVIFISIAAVGIGALWAIKYNSKSQGDGLEKYENKENIIDTDEYYEENAIIVNEIPVKKSKVVQKERDIMIDFSNRGFSQSDIIFEYDLEGNYLDETVISEESNDKHPMYQTNYITNSGDVWTIMIVNDSILAFPVSYYLEKGVSTEVLISEKETVTSYDEYKNKFYEIIPNHEIALVKTVDRLDSTTLDSFTFEELDKLW